MPHTPPRSSRAKLLIGALLVASLVAAYGYKYFTSHQQPPQAGGAAPVSVATVMERTVTKWDEFSGTLHAVERVEIRPRVAGTIEAIHFTEGEIVAKGQKLFTIDRRPYEVEAARTQAAITSAEARASYAQKEFDRAKTLLAQKVISKHEFDVAQEQHTSAQAAVKIAQAAHNQALLNLDYTLITSPITGRASRAEITVGNLVNGGGDAPVLTQLVSLDPIYADFDVDEQSFIRYLSANDNDPSKLKNVEVLLGLAGRHDFPHIGNITSFDNSLDTHAGTIRVRAVFPNSSGALVPGLFARIRMSGTGATKALLITEQAIGTDQNKKFVLVVGEDNKANYREIVPGVTVDGLRVVNKGLEPGEKIIVNGLQRTRPGSSVIPQIVPMDNPTAAPAEPEKKK